MSDDLLTRARRAVALGTVSGWGTLVAELIDEVERLRAKLKRVRQRSPSDPNRCLACDGTGRDATAIALEAPCAVCHGSGRMSSPVN